ncbi:substrate-binding periplasmic protein [Sinimarinibacterium sp. CAU 1509]|uniref:substrate-binding periplasmic protein n=1 Tax=Sinimarinibacterium sp. CAU 1509 TaxID=2562283 RepID=UPI00146BBF89|nr:transporter substrate-binding domain-containing protein [Sinimarinibacterium sp. CAU 1509]
MRTARLLFGGVSLVLAACQPSSSETPVAAVSPPAQAACMLNVGWDPWEPYQYEDAGGAVSGMDVEIIRQLAADADCGVSFVRGSWQDLLAQVRDGTVDILMGATPTAERQAYARFSPSYRHETFALFTRKDDAEALAPKTLTQLTQTGRHIGVTDGYYYGPVATQLILDEATAAAFVTAPLVELNYTRLVAGEIDALLDDPFVAAAVMRRKGWDQQIVQHPQEITSGEVSLMYSKAGLDASTMDKLDAALQARKGSGALEAVIAKYRE